MSHPVAPLHRATRRQKFSPPKFAPFRPTKWPCRRFLRRFSTPALSFSGLKTAPHRATDRRSRVAPLPTTDKFPRGPSPTALHRRVFVGDSLHFAPRGIAAGASPRPTRAMLKPKIGRNNRLCRFQSYNTILRLHTPMGQGPHGDPLYSSWYPLVTLLNPLLKFFGVLSTFLQKGAKPPEARHALLFTQSPSFRTRKNSDFRALPSKGMRG